MLRNLFSYLTIVFSFSSFSADSFIKVNQYTISDNYISEYAVTSFDKKYLFDVNHRREGAQSSATTFKVFTKEGDDTYRQSQELALSPELSASFNDISIVIYTEQYLTVIVEDINNRRAFHRFSVGEQGSLTYIDKTSLDGGYYSQSTKVMLSEGKFYEFYENTITFWRAANDGILIHLFDYQHQSDESTGDNIFTVVNDSQLIHVGMIREVTEENFFFEVTQYDIDWNNNLVDLRYLEKIYLNEYFDLAYNKIVNVLANDDSSSIFLKTFKHEFIFKGLGTENVTLEYVNEEDSNFLAVDPNTQQILETGEVLKSVRINWQNHSVVRSNMNAAYVYGTIKFLAAGLFLKTDIYGQEGQLWRNPTELNVSQMSILAVNDGDLPLDLNRKLYFDELSKQLLVTGDANDSPEEINFKLYVWDYDVTENRLTYMGSSSCCDNEQISNGVIEYPLGIFNDNYYVSVKLGANKFIARLTKTLNGIEFAEAYALNDFDGEGLLVDDVFFADNNTIVAELYGDSLAEPEINICSLNDTGQIIGCNRQKLFTEFEFGRNLTAYKFHKLSAVNQFLFAPTDNESKLSNMLFVEFNGSQFVINQQYPLKSNGSTYSPVISTTIVNQGNDLFIYNDGIAYFERENGQWNLTPSDEEYSKGELTGSHNYYLNRIGQSTVYDAQRKTFWSVPGQDRNLSGWFQLTEDGKGISVDITNTDRVITTFELSNPNPTIYIGGLNNNSNYYATQDELLKIDFSQFFYNLGSSVEVDAPEKFSFEDGMLFGTLSNDDIVEGNYAEGTQIKVEVSNESSYVGFFNIVPVNVNDAPKLKDNISREYLQVNESYYVDLNEYVSDPDRDFLTFQATGLPDGYILEDSIIQGSTSNNGDYTLNIIADDGNGKQLAFNIPITVNNSGQQEATSDNSLSAAGGTYGWSLLLLFIVALVRTSNISYKTMLH
ncbi:hypothetical protein [Aliiglaciecola sp. LCG003]|uniref:hypothetical protein n=1 Tax=Aliiglaciecola sp. LCG003 TaxID=3053655 RepID=UPI0025724780|nr:hypothetical protein [Aliiglaciecola sp. LCG003]WJG09759.1 hypothetical protein QR722_01590 [Aliiglaciecola sp. LCG003]